MVNQGHFISLIKYGTEVNNEQINLELKVPGQHPSIKNAF